MSDAVQAAIGAREFPTDLQSFLQSLQDSDGRFISQEGYNWDFKIQWPFSYSDSYFAGVCRLIAAFANTYGGIILFGVHDKKRTGGHNAVPPNLDRLQQALGDLITEPVELKIRRFHAGSAEAVDLLLVLPISADTMPVRFKRQIEGYPAQTIWVREGHEVIAAEPRHIPLLFCRKSPAHRNEDDSIIGGGLPPSPATVKKFVGRLAVIDRVFRWLKKSDEPRTFLYGKGGSGKTTLAYEIAKTLKFYGSEFTIYGNEKLDNVIFVSAKQTALDTFSGTRVEFVGREFSTERELYESILSKGSWTHASLKEMTIDEIRTELKEFFDLTSNFIVIDDVDSLTTQGTDAGFDFLYALMWRAARRSKILYTLRNAPSQSLANAIEVPGLAPGGDYEDFVRVCCEQFHVEPPSKTLLDSTIATVSERRPLVVESILALRRNSGTYERAI